MDRQIVCFSIPTLSISLARLENTSLRTKPVAVALSPSPRSSISEVSIEAQQDGIVPGLHVAQALQRCPLLQIVPPRPTHVRQAHYALEAMIRQFSPVWEPIQLGQFFFDLTGTSRLFGLACDTTMKIKRKISQHYGLVGATGLASSKLVSRIASTMVGPPQLCDIRPGSEEAFLSPLPIHALPLRPHHAKEIFPVLTDLNILTLRDLASLELTHLEVVLGQHARPLHAWAQGTDPSPVLCPPQQPHIEETMTLGSGEIDIHRLHGVLYGLLERVCRQLRNQQRICHSITVRFQYHDGTEITKTQAVKPGTYWETELAPPATKLFTRSFQRRVRVNHLTIRVEHLTSRLEQGELFCEESFIEPFSPKKAHRITLALDHIRKRFGPQAIWWGKTDDTLRSSSRSF